jgi:hypothetical protein
VRGAPIAGSPPSEVWINRPTVPASAFLHDHADALDAPAASDEALQ